MALSTSVLKGKIASAIDDDLKDEIQAAFLDYNDTLRNFSVSGAESGWQTQLEGNVLAATVALSIALRDTISDKIQTAAEETIDHLTEFGQINTNVTIPPGAIITVGSPSTQATVVPSLGSGVGLPGASIS